MTAIQGLNVKETINLILTKFTDETLSISIGLMGILFVILIAYWVYYRRKFNDLKHQIPAQVVKNYLDSIIQNSSALKSSLFRGGGLDIEDGIPSVMPTSELRGTPVQVSNASSEELNQKNAEIAALKVSIGDKDKTITELEKKLGEASSGAPVSDNSAEISSLNAKIAELEAALAAAGSGGSDDGELSKKLTEVTQERDQLKEKLQEYEIIEEDLANLKRLQQENEQLKKALEAGGGAMPSAAEPEAAAPEPEPEADPLPVEEPEAEADPLPIEEPAAENEPDPLPVDEPDPLPVEEAGAADADAEMGVPANEGEQKSAEELLSEFEKMLG
ncbi:MAG: putative phage infection (PIP) family protein YhgE [Bacteriovoracaceae bacterium]|jgi:uncharacterized phage infection (PIP) family protein YhgE